MKILCGGPSRETESDLFLEHKAGLERQRTDSIDIDVHHEIVPDPGGPRWADSKIDRVAKARQQMLDASRVLVSVNERDNWDAKLRHDHDALFMVDTDVILGDGVLERMLQVDADVVYGVFWTFSDWGGHPDDWPQVWDRHPYTLTPKFENKLRMHKHRVEEFQVWGGGACTLIRGRGFESHYYPRMKGLPEAGMWIGEDRSFCLGLESRSIKQVAVTGLPIEHRYP